MWTSRFLLPLTLLAGLMLPCLAHACMCSDGGELFPLSRPVPPNVVFHVRSPSDMPLLLIDEQGAQVPVRREVIGEGLVRLRPDSLLVDGKQYTLEEEPNSRGRRVERYRTYTVQGEPDVKPPSPPSKVYFEYRP